MNEVVPGDARSIVATMAAVLREQGRAELADVLNVSTPSFGALGEDWGKTHWSLSLAVPVGTFATLEPRLDAIEGVLLSLAQLTLRNLPDHLVDQVVVTPALEQAVRYRRPSSQAREERVWGAGLRLFLSHLSRDKQDASALKEALHLRGVSVFVAHEDIEPTLEWISEIELALATAQAMAVLLTPGFNESPWTGQEIGYVLARGLLIVPLRRGLDPYGFIGRYQGLTWSTATPEAIADQVIHLLLEKESTAGPMREALVSALQASSSFRMSQVVSKAIAATSGFTASQLSRLERAVVENDQVGNAYGVPDRVRDATARAASERTP